MGKSPRASRKRTAQKTKPAKQAKAPKSAKAPKAPKPPKPPKVEDVVEFRFSEPIDRFCDTYYVERDEAEAIWRDTMRYLWLSGTVKAAEWLEPPRVVYEMWHTFLMYT